MKKVYEFFEKVHFKIEELQEKRMEILNKSTNGILR